MRKLNILITGSSGEIGQAMAKALSNHSLALQYYNNYPEFVPENSVAVKCDLRSEDEVINMFNEINNTLGNIDVLINNCGISEFSLLQDLSLEQWNNILAVNLTSAFLCAKNVIPNMVKNQYGHIINISSVWGEVGASCEVHYSTAKGGLIAFTKALAKELAPSNILVNCVSPGLIDSKMNSRLSKEEYDEFVSDIPLNRAGNAQEVALLVRFLVQDNTYITGNNFSINGGLT